MTRTLAPHPADRTVRSIASTYRQLDAFILMSTDSDHARKLAARAILARPDALPVLQGAARTAGTRAAVLDIARTDIEDRFEEAWPQRADEWMERLGATWQESARFCADVAWSARQSGSSVLLHVTAAQALQRGVAAIAARTRLHLYAVALRYDFRCRSLEELLSAQPLQDLDPFSRSLHVFALLGQSDPRGLGLIDQVLADAEDDVKVTHALLHGLWLGEDLPGQPQRILDLLDRPAFAARPDAIALYRKARALRRLLRHDEALAAIDEAMECLPVSTDAAVHSDLVRERVLIIAAREQAS
ncbi:hypothetical protein OG689_42365 [Kitasatospora sp. NBC_00240]|uniref:hypothetical protein n=1 Tax=Kitasatospora sp. NBC_00240 TaxID=2903567 RepID=UPI00225769BB|nr:hypothetical protein [Kitasatospora sp. NBC_00240]MCX5215800.1 hypothetical protein [Kitasatospora sp. NBC_00240]